MAELTEAYEDLTNFKLTPDQIDELCARQNECTFNWATKDGWPVGVIMSYFRDGETGKLWLTCARRRKRVPAVLRDDRVSLVISSKGVDGLGSQAVTFKGHCTVHTQDDQEAYDELKKWFYPRLTAAAFPGDRTPMVDAFEKLLDSPDRVILEVDVVKEITYDGNKMGQATVKAMQAGEV